MARSNLRDPLDRFRWVVEIAGFTRFGFTTCGTPATSVATKKYPEGGAHLNPRVIVDGAEYTPITMTRGVTNDTSFNKWANGFIDLVQNNAGINGSEPNLPGLILSAIPSNDEYPFQYRRNVVIKHMNRLGQPEVAYILYNAFPVEYKPASDFDANDDSALSIESITLAYEGYEVKYSGISGTAANIAIGGAGGFGGVF